MMMGQPEAVIEQAHAEALAAPEVQDDFDIKEGDEQALEVSRAPHCSMLWKASGRCQATGKAIILVAGA